MMMMMENIMIFYFWLVARVLLAPLEPLYLFAMWWVVINAF